jgi:hypothetical protein
VKVDEDVLEVGDVMRWSSELVAQLQAGEPLTDVLVKVHKIERQTDGTVKLWLENADAPQGES